MGHRHQSLASLNEHLYSKENWDIAINKLSEWHYTTRAIEKGSWFLTTSLLPSSSA